MILSFGTQAQDSDQWKLYVNDLLRASASYDSIAHITLRAEDTGSLSLSFPDIEKEFTRTVIVMDEKRNILDRFEIPADSSCASFSLSQLLTKSKGEPVTIYMADIPSDPAKAATVRVAPVPIGEINWQQNKKSLRH